MTTPTPYSYVTSGGVHNTRVKASDATAGLSDLVQQHGSPIVLDISSIKYHNADKKEQTSIKKQLPYFVGGVINGKRHDNNVLHRTLLTLDVEQGTSNEVPPSPEDVAERLKALGGAGWIYTSISHTPNAPRYRVVLPLGKHIDGDIRAAVSLQASTQAAAQKLGIEEWTQPESWVLSQPMYLPAKLKGGKFFSEVIGGRAWGVRKAHIATIVGTTHEPAPIPEHSPDIVLASIRHAGLYLSENPSHKGMHFITCPYAAEHDAENETQTVYYEAHFDGNPRAAVKCFDTAPDVDGQPHLTYTKLVRWLKDNNHLTQDQQNETGVLDDYDAFDAKANIGRLLDAEPVARTWAIERFAPTGKVTVLAGPGGVSKSMLMLHVLVHASTGRTWGGFKVAEPLRSLYVSYEDDTQELHKRIHALASALRGEDSGTFDLLYDVTSSINNNIRVFAADDDAAQWLLLTKPERFGLPTRTERVEWLIGYLQAKQIKLVVLDPAVYTHQLEENNIADMATYMQTLTYIAKQAQCAVVVLHHVNKISGWAQIDDINQGSLRGASSFADNARSVSVIVSIPIKDADSYGLTPDHETTRKYAILKHVKHNYSAPLDTMVFERKGVLLIPRPDIVRLDRTQITEARDHAKSEEQTRRVLQWADRVLEMLADTEGPVSVNQISVELNTRAVRIKPVLEYCETQDWIDIEPGPNRSQLHAITKLGRSYLRALKAKT